MGIPYSKADTRFLLLLSDFRCEKKKKKETSTRSKKSRMGLAALAGRLCCCLLLMRAAHWRLLRPPVRGRKQSNNILRANRIYNHDTRASCFTPIPLFKTIYEAFSFISARKKFGIQSQGSFSLCTRYFWRESQVESDDQRAIRLALPSLCP